MFVGEIMSIKLLNEKRMDELIQFIHQEEITKEYLKQNQKIIMSMKIKISMGLLFLMLSKMK